MQSALENISTRDTLWSRDEISGLIEYAKQLQSDNEDLRAGIIMMQAKLDNEEAKVRRLTNYINQIQNQNSQM
jgi:septal ring factor EnvC (AmiA/AmiB activator)